VAPASFRVVASSKDKKSPKEKIAAREKKKETAASAQMDIEDLFAVRR
jgi:hypothetical protein